MFRAKVLTWITFAVLVWAATGTEGGGLGVNWGTMSSQTIDPKIVINMLKNNGIKKVKLFDSDERTVKALVGSGLETMLAIPNDMLARMADDYDHAQEYVEKNVTKYMYDGGVDIKYVAVGNEPFLTSYNGSYLHTLFPALKNVQKALEEAGFGKIKAVVPHNADVYESTGNKPSTGKFRDDIKDLMLDLVMYLHSKKAPFVVNIYPFLSLYQNPDFPVDFAFFDGGGGNNSTNDRGIQYNNVFDANYDTLVWTLRKTGISDIKIIVGEAGWPTDGDKHASVNLAHRFYRGFMKKMAQKKGTPLRPSQLEVYLFGLFDENMKSVAPGNFERHWGIFRYDGKPKFPVDLSGNGQEKLPIAAKGVKYLDEQWCIFDKTVTEMDLVPPQLQIACSQADCTPLGYGSSCSHLDKNGNTSYAFNIYYQMQGQTPESCDFNGLATLTQTNASQKGCLFPIEIVKSWSERIKVVSVTSILFFFIVVVLM